MNKLMEQTLLYDFYGELLTEHQRSVYEDFTFRDLSLGEIAETAGISRQGVHDLIKRCQKQLAEYESKLHLMEKFMTAREKIAEIRNLFQEYQKLGEENLRLQIEDLLEDLLENL